MPRNLYRQIRKGWTLTKECIANNPVRFDSSFIADFNEKMQSLTYINFLLYYPSTYMVTLKTGMQSLLCI